MIITNLTCECIKIQFNIENYIIFKFDHVNFSCVITDQVISNRRMIHDINDIMYNNNIDFGFGIINCPEFSFHTNTIYLRGDIKSKNNRDMLWTYKGDNKKVLFYNCLYATIKSIKKLF